MSNANDRTRKARLWCRNCEDTTLHYFSHEMLVEERKRGIGGTYIDRTIDLWYKCQRCMSIRKWGQENLLAEAVPTRTRKSE